jgi:hypothetical protein
MRNTLKSLRGCIVIVLFCSLVGAQSTNSTPSPVVPPLVKFTGVLTDVNSKALTGTVGVTFSLYNEAQGGSALWVETQNVTPDKAGHYSVMLGSTTTEGIPASLFANGEARWLGVQAQGQTEQPRTLLMSVPYALKALDAETIGGKPASSFMLAPQAGGTSTAPGKLPPGTITGSGTADFIPIFTGTTTVGNSKIFQTVGGDVGIGTTTPAAVLDVKGTGDVRDTLTLFPKSTHNALSVHGTAFAVSDTGKVTFITGQTFPGTGTVTSVGSGAGLTGGPITGSGTLSIATAGVSNAMLQNSSITLNANSAGGVATPGAMTLGSTYTIGLKACSANQVLEYSGSVWSCVTLTTGTITGVTAGTDLTGGGTSGTVTLNLDTTKVPQLATNNSFTGTQTVSLSSNNAIVASTAGPGNVGLWGIASATSGGSNGVYGTTSDGSGSGVVGTNSSGGTGVSGTGGVGVNGNGVNYGVVASASSSTGYGVYSAGDSAVVANGGTYGVNAAATTYGVYATASAGDGVVGLSSSGTGNGVVGRASGANGVFGSATTGNGVFGTENSGGYGVYGESTSSNGVGVAGLADNADGAGAAFYNDSTGDALFVYEQSGGDAAFLEGNVDVDGNLSKAGGSFKIDHPLDPANKYLYHSFVESPDMKNIYDGVATLNANGEATIEMPEWFGVLNRDFRYQLTCIGGFAPVYIADELANNQFKIGGGRAGMRISWQITGIRQDAWANAHRIPVEQEKEAKLKGFYLHPELYGAPAGKQIQWARHPEMMKKLLQSHEQMNEKRAGLIEDPTITRPTRPIPPPIIGKPAPPISPAAQPHRVTK